jgi:hypothetical protein
MVRTALVSTDIESGSTILAVLDQSKLKTKVALWAVLPEYEDWRLVLSGRRFDAKDVNPYGLLNESLAAAGFPLRKTPIITILPMADLFIKDLRRVFAKTKSVEGMRLGGQMIGDRFIEDAYVYRIS